MTERNSENREQSWGKFYTARLICQLGTLSLPTRHVVLKRQVCRESFHRIFRFVAPCLELEIDEGLHLGTHELIDDEDGEDADETHRGQRHRGKGETVAAFPVLWQPMDNHT